MGVKCFGSEGFSAGRFRLALAVFSLWAGLSVAGCGHDPPPPPAAPVPPCSTPEPLRVSLQTGQHLNPGEHREALATVVRLYQLKSTAKISNASFDDLLDHDRDALGEDFLAVQEVTINPGDKLEPPMTRLPETTVLGAVALFRQPTGTTWRAIVKLPPPDPQHCHAAERSKAAPGKVTDNTTRIFLDEYRLELR